MGYYSLPSCTFTPPEGKQFSHWNLGPNSSDVYNPDDTFYVYQDRTFYAVWMDEAEQTAEQFSLAPGDTYYFDLSSQSIPGTANSGTGYGAAALPDTSLHYVPFTYIGTVEAYKLTSAMETTEEYAQQNQYAHSLFIADYAVTHTVSWMT